SAVTPGLHGWKGPVHPSRRMTGRPGACWEPLPRSWLTVLSSGLPAAGHRAGEAAVGQGDGYGVTDGHLVIAPDDLAVLFTLGHAVSPGQNRQGAQGLQPPHQR